MKIYVDSKDLLTISEQIQYYCDLLDTVDAEDAEEDIPVYTSQIQCLAADLGAIAELRAQKAAEEGESR